MYDSFPFSKINFATQESTIVSVSSMLASMKVAAMISVVAVGCSLLFLIIERILYKNLCKTPLALFQLEINRLFDNISSEKFLVDLLKETKLQNNSMNNALESIPVQMKEAFENSLKSTLIPYLDNLIFSVNNLQENIKKTSAMNVLNELFDKEE